MYTSKGGIIYDQNGTQVAPCESVDNPAFVTYQAWANAGNNPTIIDLPVPIEVSSWQLRKALNALGLRAAIETDVANSNNQDLKDGFEFAAFFQSDNAMVLAMGQTIGKNADEIRAVFQLASTL